MTLTDPRQLGGGLLDPDEKVEIPDEVPRHGGNKMPWIRLPGLDYDPHLDDGDAKSRRGRGAYYYRASSWAEPLANHYLITNWMLRGVVYGMSRDESLVMAAQAVGSMDERDELQRLETLARVVAGQDQKAREGSAFHKMTERRERGEDLSHLPARHIAALDAWTDITSIFETVSMEQLVVWDEYGVAGSYDRLWRLRERVPIRSRKGELLDVLEPGAVVIGDLKGLALDTPLPTPTGWTTMGAVQPGDRVLGSDGHPCAVIEKSITRRIGTYIVEFDDGERIVCDREHLWWVMTGRGGRLGMREQVLGVEELRSTLFRYGQRQHRVPVAAPLELPDVELPIDPYLLGCWLGDGKHTSGEITKGEDLFDLLRADGHELGKPQAKVSTTVVARTVIGLRTRLRRAGLLGHKAIPDAYLRGSVAQRVALLRGLMDTDGSWNITRQRAVFYSTDKALAEQVVELCATLGLRPHLGSWLARGFGKEVTAYGVEFRAQRFNPFRLPRKADQVEYGNGSRARYRIVRSVEPGPDAETACIAVDSPNRTYLCGRGMVPTHNSGRTSRYFDCRYAMQQLPYSHGVPYSHRGGRTEWPGGAVPSQRWAVIPHVSHEDEGVSAQLLWVDLEAAHRRIPLLQQVRELAKSSDLFLPHTYEPVPDGDEAASVTIDVVGPVPARPLPRQAVKVGILTALMEATSKEQMVAVWDEHHDVWDEDCERMAHARAREFDLTGGPR